MSLNVLKNSNKSEFRFLIIGGCSTLIDFIIYMIISNYINITLAKLCSMMIASVFSYIFNKNWTFKDKENTSIKLVMKYVFSQIINILVNTMTNTLVYNMTRIKILSFVCATAIALVINFLLQKIVVFNGGK